jgi:hypothetical protein
MKYNYDIKEFHRENKFLAVEFVQEHHYSKVFPKITKHYLGVYLDKELVGILTLGWGTQPLATIRKLFPDLVSKDYLEIGKMCMHPDMPKNSESQLLSAVIRWIKDNKPTVKFLFTWADGIVGKPGYVYQSANFLYGGFIWTDIYIGPDGEKIHPRSTRKLLEENAEFIGRDTRMFWMSPDFTHHKGIRRVRGKQFRYIMPLNKRAKKLLKTSTVEWNLNYPKHKDLEWKEQAEDGSYFDLSEIPEFKLDVVNVNKRNVGNADVVSDWFE